MVDPQPPRRQRDPGIFVGVFFGVATVVLFLLQANGVDVVGWKISAALYLLCIGVIVRSLHRHAIPEPEKKLVRWFCTAVIVLVMLVLGRIGTTKEFMRENSQKPAQTPYSISAGPIVGGIDFWALDANRTALTPVRLIVFLQIVNRQDKSAMIKSFRFEGLDVNTNQWHSLNYIDTTRAQIFFGINIKDLYSINLRLLDKGLRDTDISPGKTVEGWLLFAGDAPAAYTQFRIRIKDSMGNEFNTAPFRAEQTDDDYLVKYRGYQIVTTHNDLSGIPIEQQP